MDANTNLSANIADYAELSSIGLTRGRVARIENGSGMRLRVESGSVWLTHHHCSDDVILKAGESYRIAKDGLTLVTNLNGSFAMVTLEPAITVKPTFAERFWSSWSSLYAPNAHPTTAAL